MMHACLAALGIDRSAPWTLARSGHMTRRAFTLIELLVVVAIITILAAILLPTLTQARGRAQSMVCLNNVKQMITAGILYSDDNEGYLPTTTRYRAVWMISMSSYLGSERPGMSSQVNTATGPDKFYATFRCPTTFSRPRTLYYYGTYGYNLPTTSADGSGGSSDPNSSAYIGRYVRALDKIKETSRTVMLADCYIINAEDFASYSASADPANTDLRTRCSHQGYTLNFGFCDGSAANLRAGQRKDLLLGVSNKNASDTIKGWTGLE